MDTQTAPRSESGVTQLSYLESGVAILALGGPDEKKVSLTRRRLESLKTNVDHLTANPPKALIITGPREDMFTVGADINLLSDVSTAEEGAALAKEAQKFYQAIEELPFYTVAAISGPCVGGGCELVLCCDYRIITDHETSQIGLPETKLGILPGLGGTQRMPRLIGLPKALDIILAGKIRKPKQALSIGLVNEIVALKDLPERAEAVALGKAKRKAVSISFVDRLLTNTSLGRSIVRKNASAALKKQTRGFYPAPPAALETVLYGLQHGKARGLEKEAEEFGKLIITPESKALVRIFFLTEISKGIGKSAKSAVDHLHGIVVGAGVMGAGIAGTLAKNGAQVILKDTSEESLERGMKHIRGYLSSLRYLDERERSFILNRIERTTRDSTNLGNANFAIEAIFERMDIKKKVLGELAGLMPEDALITTNTSSLSVTEIASGIKNPARVAGMHFFNPVEKMPLVEIIRGEQTSDKTIVVLAALASKLGKYPIVVNDVPGFLVNRILTPYLNEAAFLLQDGYSIRDIDSAALKFGMPMGPLRLLDEVGLDVAAHVAETMLAGYGDRMKGPGYAKKILDAGRTGRKSQAGFYDYSSEDDKKGTPHAGIRSILGLAPVSKTGDVQKEITDRLVMSLVNEAVKCLDEGVAGNPGPEAASQIDLGTVMGMGFPPFRGGLLYYAESRGAKEIAERMIGLQKSLGDRFKPAEGVVKRAESGQSFIS